MKARNIAHHSIRLKLKKMEDLLKPEVISQLDGAQYTSVIRELRRISMKVCRIARRMQKLSTVPTKELP